MAKKIGWKGMIQRQMKRVHKGGKACTFVPAGVTKAQVQKAIGKGHKVTASGKMFCTTATGPAKAKKAKKRSKRK